MSDKKQIAEILKTVTLVMCIVLIGFLISACQSTLNLKKVNLPSEKKPLINEKATKEDFAYPTKDPSVVEGKQLFTQNCSACHSFGSEANKNEFTLKYINSVPPSQLFKVITNDDKHESFREKLTRQERWDIVMYVRYTLFGLPKDVEDVKVKFGSNCAVCHGTRGFADGPIHYFLNPPPANFNQFDRLYEKTDEKLFDEVSNGIPWTAMPPWAGRVDKDKHFEFDEKFRWELVKFIRQFGYSTEKDILREKELFEAKESKKEEENTEKDK
ncbi:MAG: c-type cytochrome [Candidatus Melainabacteria bacterium]|nr:c-type cytochrome [Candidatus Melainabacteria bacterium]